MRGSNPRPGPLSVRKTRTRFDFLRKLAAVLLVLASVACGTVGLGLATSGNLWGLALIAVTPLGIWLATRVTPEGGTTGYFDKNI